MGSKNKLKRFQDNEVFENVIQPLRSEIVDEEFQLKGKWKRDFFKNDKPLILELGCGKGEYTLGLAERNKDCNYLGIDIKGARFWKGAKRAFEDDTSNVGFLRTQIELVDQVFSEGEVDGIWITFPDPQIKWKRTKHRITNPKFLEKYKHILTEEGIIHLKTDSEFIHGYTLGILEGLGHEIIYAHHNIYVNHEAPEEVVGIQTFYEQQYLDKNKLITYLKFRLKL